MIFWNDEIIREWAESGGVDPFDSVMINPTSLDLRLGNTYRIPQGDKWSDEIRFEKLILKPQDFVLCSSVETTKLKNTMIAFLFLKSSIGRKGIEHLHAGFGDAGFCGQWTFELINHWPFNVELIAGQRICQLVFSDCFEPKKDYSKTGRYQNQSGPTPARG